jgi:hypothetical protein
MASGRFGTDGATIAVHNQNQDQNQKGKQESFMATQVTHSTRGRSDVSDRQIAGVILMAAGWGWISGNFVDPFLPFFFGGFIDLVHFVPAVVLLLLSMRFFRASAIEVREGGGPSGAHTGISIVAVFSILACALFVILGLSNPDPNSLGVHTIEDWLPVIVLNAGTFLWLSTLVRARRAANMPVRVRDAES